MASRPLTEADVQPLVPSEPGRPLGFLYLVDAEEHATWRTTAFVLRVRRGGFLVGVPNEDRVLSVLTAMSGDESEEVIVFKLAVVEAETPRRRAVGEIEILLVDVPWSYLGLFRKPAPRATGLPELVPFKKGDVVVRPIRESAIGAAEAWISEVIDDPALIEYQTAESQHDDEAGEEDEGEAGEQEDASSEVIRLRARIAELQARTVPPATQPRPGANRGARTLFPDAKQESLSAEQWNQLRAAAGGPPGRMARHERKPRDPKTVVADDELAEEECGARPEDTSGEGSLLQQLLITQTKLLERLTAGRPSDPISAALSGASGSSDSSMGSAKGITAREAYVKLIEQQPSQVATAIRTAAAHELGHDPANPPSSLMRTYVERKMIIGEHRQLALIAHFFGHCWEAAREDHNEQMEFWMARGLLMLDQFGVDQGRTTMGWLFAALPDPLWSQLQRKRSGLKPYARLAAGPWVAANCAFLRDLDYLDSRLKTAAAPTGQPTTDPPADGDDDDDSKARRLRRPKRKPGKPGDTTA